MSQLLADLREREAKLERVEEAGVFDLDGEFVVHNTRVVQLTGTMYKALM